SLSVNREEGGLSLAPPQQRGGPLLPAFLGHPSAEILRPTSVRSGRSRRYNRWRIPRRHFLGQERSESEVEKAQKYVATDGWDGSGHAPLVGSRCRPGFIGYLVPFGPHWQLGFAGQLGR